MMPTTSILTKSMSEPAHGRRVIVLLLMVGDDGDADAGDATYISVDYETEIGELGLALHYGAYDAEDWGLQDLATDMSICFQR